MKDKAIWFKLIFSITFIVLAILIVFSDWAKSNISPTAIVLIIIAFFPWMIKYIKSLEAFGLKVELVTEEKMQKINQIIEPISNKEIDYILEEKTEKNKQKNNIIHCDSINSILNAEDPISKLVLGRYELEKVIRLLSEKNNIDTNGSIIQLTRRLYNEKYISNNEYELIEELLPILNKAVHSDINNVSEDQIKWVVSKVIRILEFLDYRYKTGKDFADWLKI